MNPEPGRVAAGELIDRLGLRAIWSSSSVDEARQLHSGRSRWAR
ncbi:MAG: hypothetical protein EBS20_04680 [Actinobacteria bacterium]|nr:hypothetical protein [Actinomycetota bacterium]